MAQQTAYTHTLTLNEIQTFNSQCPCHLVVLRRAMLETLREDFFDNAREGRRLTTTKIKQHSEQRQTVTNCQR